MLIRLFLLLAICFISLYAQQQEKVVAKVGNYKIYESEFKERFDFSVHPKLLQESDKLAAKQKFLEQLIAEKLLSLEAKEKGYDTLQIFNNIINPLENMYVRDALYNREIKNKAVYTQDEINQGLQRIRKSLKVKFIFSPNKEEIENIYLQLKSSVSFDSLLSLRPEVKDQAEPNKITFGTMDKQVEDNIYRLNVGEFTAPVESKDGYYLLKLIDIGPNQDLKGEDLVLDDVKRIVETRAEYKTYLDYYHNYFNQFKISADREIFERLIRIFVPKFKAKYSSNEIAIDQIGEVKNNKIYLNGIEVTSVNRLLDTEIQNKIFIKLNDNPIKVEYFLNQLSQDGFYVKDTSELSIRASLSSYIRKFIEDQLLTYEGKKNGLDNSPDVKKYIGMWKDSYLSKLLMGSMFDSIKVSEQEAYSIYKQNDWKEIIPMELVNVVEVLTDSLAVMEKILSEISSGKDLRDLAKQYTKRDSLKDKGGEFGFFPATEHGEIGKAASEMEVGDIYGPIKLDEGYSIFQLIGKKEDTTSYSKSFDEVREQLVTQLTLIRFEKYVNEYNARLADKYGVEINENVLKGIDDIFMNLMVVRYMGFGGEIFAVPYTEQFAGWYDIWLKKKDLAQ